MAYGYQAQDGAQEVLDAIDAVGAHMLPFFAWDASTGEIPTAVMVDYVLNSALSANNSWHNNQNDLDWFLARANGKKIYFTQVHYQPRRAHFYPC